MLCFTCRSAVLRIFNVQGKWQIEFWVCSEKPIYHFACCSTVGACREFFSISDVFSHQAVIRLIHAARSVCDLIHCMFLQLVDDWYDALCCNTRQPINFCRTEVVRSASYGMLVKTNLVCTPTTLLNKWVLVMKTHCLLNVAAAWMSKHRNDAGLIKFALCVMHTLYFCISCFSHPFQNKSESVFQGCCTCIFTLIIISRKISRMILSRYYDWGFFLFWSSHLILLNFLLSNFQFLFSLHLQF